MQRNKGYRYGNGKRYGVGLKLGSPNFSYICLTASYIANAVILLAQLYFSNEKYVGKYNITLEKTYYDFAVKGRNN